MVQYRWIPENERRWHKTFTDILVDRYHVWGTLPKWNWVWLAGDGTIVDIKDFWTDRWKDPMISLQDEVQSTVANLI
ncbi:MAG: hypothetical protein ACD_78C00126G0001 [uncultured bacterium (gcode 4)]|uniref:Uncharacterized protein n=1 Tax=uncultured bacterium (gcode 4) TaxID=1234023 RepID=K1YD87_9BACT|nr:MAG: hypothetical protein ACD_78C00126G0001 [uncultured bacterium (gcode 4)]